VHEGQQQHQSNLTTVTQLCMIQHRFIQPLHSATTNGILMRSMLLNYRSPQNARAPAASSAALL
jgi:hypothetical protein